jgi:hypothetical protein
MSMPLDWAIARISRASWAGIFSVTMKILRISGLTRISSADAVPGRGRGQVDDAAVEPVPVGQALQDVVVDGDVAQRVGMCARPCPGEVPKTTLPPE